MSDSNVKLLDLEQAARAIFLCIYTDTPVVLWGESGWAKSAVLRNISKAIQHEWRDIRTGQHDPTEFAVPCPVKSVSQSEVAKAGEHWGIEYATADYLPFEDHVGDKQILLAFEEIDRGSMAMQNAVLSILMEKEYAQHKMGSGVRMVATGNGAADPGGTLRLNEAAERRFVHIYLDHKSTETRDAVAKYGAGAGWHSATLSTMKDMWPELCQKSKPYRFYEYGKPCGRTVEYADRIVRAHLEEDGCGVPTDDVVEALICGALGVDVGMDFWDRFQLRAAFDVEAIFSNPVGAPLPDSPDKIITWRDLVAEEIGKKRGANRVTCCDNAILWADRLPTEQSIGVVESFVLAAPEARESGVEYKKFQAKNGLDAE